MHLRVASIVMALAVLASADGLSAHHSVPVNFDQTREVTISGVLTEISWRNPHAKFRINVTNPDGSIVEWLAEMGAVNTLKRAGFPLDRFVVGDRIAVTGWPGRHDRTVLLRETVLPDGTRLNPDMRAPGSPAGSATPN